MRQCRGEVGEFVAVLAAVEVAEASQPWRREKYAGRLARLRFFFMEEESPAETEMC